MSQRAKSQVRFGDTSLLPTPVFLFGAQPQQEIAVEIDPGKTLLVASQSVAPDGELARKVQVELNGQARTVRVALEKDGGGGARVHADPVIRDMWRPRCPGPS
jgi:pyruvate carboxylase